VNSREGVHMRVLVVEDEALLAAAIAEWLRGDTHAVDVVHDGDRALEHLAINDYDVVVLDRDLPVVHGDDVCRALAKVGFLRVNQKGSHVKLRNASGRNVIVPMHREIAEGTLRSIIRQSGLTVDEFLALL